MAWFFDNVQFGGSGALRYTPDGWRPEFSLTLGSRRNYPEYSPFLQDFFSPRIPPVPRFAIEPPSPSVSEASPSDFKAGDSVYVHVKKNEFKKLQDKHKIWDPNMEKVIGKQGIVVNENVDGRMIIVDFRQGRWALDPQCVELVPLGGVMTGDSDEATPGGAVGGTRESGPDEQFRALEILMEKLDVNGICPGCNERPIRLVFQCTHGSCRECNATLEECPKCSANIIKIVRLPN